MFKCIKLWLETHVFKSTVQSIIAERLRNGADMVRVRYRNRNHDRYYTGSGQSFGGIGRRARYNISVESFRYMDDSRHIYEHKAARYVNTDEKELDLVLADNFDNVKYMEDVRVSEGGIDELVKALTDIAARLRVGQGYDFGRYYITRDFIHPQGYIFREGPMQWIVPLTLIQTAMFTKPINPDKPFDAEKVFVHDEHAIKRIHRKKSDIRRWYEVKATASRADDWVFSFTPKDTAVGPVTYHTLEITIDRSGMETHPFYVRPIVEDAITFIKQQYHESTLEIRPDFIKVTWDNTTRLVSEYIRLQANNPRFTDKNPILIHDEKYELSRYHISTNKTFKLKDR